MLRITCDTTIRSGAVGAYGDGSLRIALDTCATSILYTVVVCMVYAASITPILYMVVILIQVTSLKCLLIPLIPLTSNIHVTTL